MKKRFLKIGLPIIAVAIVAAILSSTVFSNPVKVYAKSETIAIGNTQTAQPMSQEEIQQNALDSYDGANISSSGRSSYSIAYPGNGGEIDLGDMTAPKQLNYTPDFQVSLWNAQVSFDMTCVTQLNQNGALVASYDDTTQTLTAQNDDWTWIYTPTAPTVGFNENGGLDLTIIDSNPDNTNVIDFSYDSDNVTVNPQPSLTQEWTVGQTLPNGNTVASVTDTDVTGTDGLVHAHRPDYVVNSLEFQADGLSNYEIGSVNYATGEVGMVYRMKETGANGETGWANWSYDGSDIYLTIDPTGMTYPITCSPAGDTFGYITLGSSSSNGAANYYPSASATQYSPAGNGTITSMSIGAETPSGSCSVVMGLYSGSVGSGSYITGSLTSTVTVNSSTLSWYTGTDSASVSAQNYFLCAEGNPNWSSIGFWAYTSGSGNGIKYGTTGNQSLTFPSTDTFAINNPTTGIYSIYCTYTASGGSTYNLTNSPTSIDFGVIQPNTKYYAYGSAPSNPVTDGQCTFTITNGQANAIKVNIQATDFTGGGGWTLGTPDGTHARLIAYYSGENPASGVTLTTSPQTFVASLAGSATLKWDFSWETPTSFADGTQKSSTITLTGLAP